MIAGWRVRPATMADLPAVLDLARRASAASSIGRLVKPPPRLV
jgi:hypothetical protein